MKQKPLLKMMLLLCALVAGVVNGRADTYERLTSITGIDESAQYVLGIDGTGFHYSGTSSWGLVDLPSNQTPLYYTLKKASDGNSFTAETTIGNTKYYLQIPTSNTFSMATSTGTNTDIIIGTTQVSGTNYAVANKTTTTRHLRINGNSGLRSYAGTTGNMAYFYKVIPEFTLIATSNNTTWGTVAVLVNRITATPAAGYRVSTTNPYTVTAGTATVAQEDNVFTVTASAACTVQINFEAIPTYTVTFDAEGGSCATASATESFGGAGVTLPTASIDVAGWEFIGWAEQTVTNTNAMPALFAEGAKYYPSGATTLHAVYTLSTTGLTYTRVTSLEQIPFANKIAIVSNRTTTTVSSKILTHDASTVNAPTEASSEITVAANQIFDFSGNNATGYVFTGANGTLSQSELSTSSSTKKAIDWTGTNNKWVLENNNYANATSVFTIHNIGSDKASLIFDSGWKTYYVNDYSSNTYTAMKLYVPKTAYNSNPSAIVTSTVNFEKGDVTLYLDGTTSYTNTATKSGSNMPIVYSSSDTKVATVTSEGVVTAVGIGTATITASVDAELGVSAAASDTYEVTVKSATTLAGIKAQATSSTAVDFTADLSNDVVITYVNGAHAFLQSGEVAIYANCATNDWAAGKKFTGSITGKVKKYYNEYQITEINQAPVDGGVVPDAVEVAITDLTIENYATYEGRRVVINGATVSTSMANTATSGGQISDGTNTQSINAPVQGVALTKNERGNFVGYIGRYSDAIRLYMYEQSWFTKTHNVPQNQVMSFTESSYTFDEDTEDVTNFAGQEVTETTVKGEVTYAIKDGSDDIITSLNAATGGVVLNGNCGTATIVATAAYAEETDGGVITPYNALSKEYTVTVRPRYTVTFSVNGEETALRESSYGAGVTVPANPAAIGDYVFQGWMDAEVAETNTMPSLASLTAGGKCNPSGNVTYYAVFAKEMIVPNVEQTSTFNFQTTEPTSPYVNNEGTWTWTSIERGSSTNKSVGLKSGNSITFTPSTNVTSIKSIRITKTGQAWGDATLSLTDANTNVIASITRDNINGNSTTEDNYSVDLTSHQSSSYTLSNTTNKNAWIKTIVFTYIAPQVTTIDYTTTVIPGPSDPVVNGETVTLATTVNMDGWRTFYDASRAYQVDANTKIYVVRAKSATANVVELTTVATAQIPAAAPVILKTTAANREMTLTQIASADAPSADALGNNLLTVTDGTHDAAGYRLGYNATDGVAFYPYTATAPAAGIVYLATDNVNVSLGARGLLIVVGEEPSAIQTVAAEAATAPRKVLKNGRIVVETTEGTFSLMGTQVK